MSVFLGTEIQKQYTFTASEGLGRNLIPRIKRYLDHLSNDEVDSLSDEEEMQSQDDVVIQGDEGEMAIFQNPNFLTE